MSIGFFGCSFTAGGGLNSPIFVDYAIRNNMMDIDDLDDEVEIWGLTEKQSYIKNGKNHGGLFPSVAEKFCYPTLVGKKLNCDIVNYATGASGNEHIFNLLYENYTKHDICVVQFSFYHRMYIYDSNTKKHYDVHGTENQSSPQEVVDYFKKSYTEFYDKEYEKKKINMMVNLFDSLNKKIYWMFHDVIPIELVDNKNVIYFPILEENTKTEYRIPGASHFNDCLTYFTEHFGLILSEETKGEYKDNHFSIKGHQIIAEKVIEKINE